MKLRYANSYQARAATRAAELLHDALILARMADCPRLVRRIRAALASSGGAIRHMGRRIHAQRPVQGVLHVTNTDRRQFAAVQKPLPGIPASYRFAYAEDSVRRVG